jgi:hypothetical protein
VILRQILRQIVWQRLLYGRRPRSYGYRMGGGHRASPFGFGRPRGRTQVRVGGCCLPIPLVLTTGLGLAAGRRRRRR